MYLYFIKLGKSIITILHLLFFLYKYNHVKIGAIGIES
jgi:hypothetical protein